MGGMNASSVSSLLVGKIERHATFRSLRFCGKQKTLSVKMDELSNWAGIALFFTAAALAIYTGLIEPRNSFCDDRLIRFGLPQFQRIQRASFVGEKQN